MSKSTTNCDQAHYLWGFSNKVASYFEVHGTRSGDVISELLKDSKCEYLVSDAFSGNIKSVKDTNAYRIGNKLNLIQQVYCNAHARRKFKEAREKIIDAQLYIDIYKKIYYIEGLAKENPPDWLRSSKAVLRVQFLGTSLWTGSRVTRSIWKTDVFGQYSKFHFCFKRHL